MNSIGSRSNTTIMKTDIEIKLKNALNSKIIEIKEARIDGIIEKDFQILTIEHIQPTIVSPHDILKGDYFNAEEIQFQKGQIRVSRRKVNDFSENMYYFDGSAKVNFINNHGFS